MDFVLDLNSSYIAVGVAGVCWNSCFAQEALFEERKNEMLFKLRVRLNLWKKNQPKTFSSLKKTPNHWPTNMSISYATCLFQAKLRTCMQMFLRWRNPARLVDVWGHRVLFAVAKSTICLHLYVPKSSLTGRQAVWETSVFIRTKCLQKIANPLFVILINWYISVLAQSYMSYSTDYYCR